MKRAMIASILLFLFFELAFSQGVPIQVKINSNPELELEEFSISNPGSNPLIAEFSLKNIGNAFTTLKPAVFVEQGKFKRKVFLPEKRLEWKDSIEFRAFIDKEGLGEGSATITLSIEYSAGGKHSLITETREVTVQELGKWESGIELVKEEETRFAGLQGTIIEGEIRVWNNSMQEQRIYLFARSRQDLVESKTIFLEGKSRKVVPIKATIPEETMEVELIACNREQRSNPLKLELEKIIHPTALVTQMQSQITGIIAFLGILVFLFVFSIIRPGQGTQVPIQARPPNYLKGSAVEKGTILIKSGKKGKKSKPETEKLREVEEKIRAMRE